ncbi:flagellar basal-body MS-ring/collar protein FliF [Halopseudomonas sp.]|uniref:flagellar basal-body MS-ring/collar protein FliF n=1 Tax=Halopseudomonas sp. TaxID=2901191 RepID=UPI0030021F81
MSNFLAGRSSLFAVGAALIFILLGVAAWWVLRPGYVALYDETSEASQAEVLAVLGQWQLPYRINAEAGSISVPVDTLAAARMHLAEAGIPAKLGAGFELFDQADYGMSEFSQKVNYQRALEGELARTIMGLSEVQFARVHITFKKAGLYQQSSEQAKASVILRFKPNASLDAAGVKGVQQLVASAVEGMDADAVVILGDDGQTLSRADGALASSEHMQTAAEVERQLTEKVKQLLLRPLGPNGADVSVRVAMNFDRVTSIREVPLGGGRESLQRSKEVSSNQSGVDGETGGRSQSTRETEYAVGSERSEIAYATGKVERISVGVVLAAPLDAAGVQELHALIAAAIGLDEPRGDQLVITHLPVAVASAPSLQSTAFIPAETVDSLPDASDSALTASPLEQWLLEHRKALQMCAAVLAALLALLLLSILWRLGRKPTASFDSPRLSLVERERLVKDLRQWLAEGRQT